MDDLSHWDFADQFDGYEAAALILGIEPRGSEAEEGRIRVVCDRMALDFAANVAKSFGEFLGDPAEVGEVAPLKSVQLETVERRYYERNQDQQMSDWFANRNIQRFDNQQFTRAAVIGWLRAIGMPSVYSFDRQRTAPAAWDLDPSDLPLELQAANIAFRAVSNGYGDADATFKSRLIAYLEANFLDLGMEAVKRIATVANPDKEPGRKRRGPE